MNCFKSVFSDDLLKDPREEEDSDPDRAASIDEHGSNPNPSVSMLFGGLMNNFATQSESVFQAYRRDLEEFRSALEKETAEFGEVSSRVVKELPVSIEFRASVLQDSLDSIRQAIDDFENSVWIDTVEIFSHGNHSVLAANHKSDSSDNHRVSNQRLKNSKRYSRFHMQVRAIQTDFNTYCEEPEDVDGFNKWKLGFVLEEKVEEVENLFKESGDLEWIYANLVPNSVDRETFWSRYFFGVHKLKQAEDARANLVKRLISSEKEEDLTWDFDEDDEEINVSDSKADSSENRDSEKRDSSYFVTEESQVGSSEAFADMGENDSDKDSDFSVISSQTSLPEEEDLEWDKIEDLGSLVEKKFTLDGSQN
ncbi:hypothetical protein HHK36_020682 [Tetracentron sinense]|uniref:BSD domain-containing protein n=1 Tax=Tetracentron sinense TaxID=13715 RepID=A0A835DBU9_TETSI|nr:hypothetical protein HHK36_020682 [Tetracentron sinense]